MGRLIPKGLPSFASVRPVLVASLLLMGSARLYRLGREPIDYDGSSKPNNGLSVSS